MSLQMILLGALSGNAWPVMLLLVYFFYCVFWGEE